MKDNWKETSGFMSWELTKVSALQPEDEILTVLFIL